MNIMFKNWRCYSYGLHGDKAHKQWSFKELSKYFDIRGTGVCKCKAPIFDYEPGKFYLISDGGWYGYGFLIGKDGFRNWTDWEDKNENH